MFQKFRLSVPNEHPNGFQFNTNTVKPGNNIGFSDNIIIDGFREAEGYVVPRTGIETKSVSMSTLYLMVY